MTGRDTPGYSVPVIRNREVSRLEGFSDAVFGFALTLLVVSLETPKTIDELRNLAGSFLPFVLMFAMVTWIWYQHNRFFRRYGEQDAWTVFLNSVLLFVVLFYVYPLKFLTLALVGPLTMDPATLPDVRTIDGPMVMTLYSTGVVVIFAIFLLLHRHAWNRRSALGFSEMELIDLRFATRGHALSAGLGVASLLLVAAMPHNTFWSGVVYGLMGPLHGWNGYLGGRTKEAFEKRQAATLEEHTPSAE